MTFDRKGNWDMGLKLERMDGSKFFFLINGCTVACLKVAGTCPERRLVFNRATRLGPTEQNTSLRRRGGMLSVGQFVGRRWETMSESEERVTGSK